MIASQQEDPTLSERVNQRITGGERSHTSAAASGKPAVYHLGTSTRGSREQTC